MAPDKVRLGFVGAGYMGQLAHIEHYWKLPGVELAALAEGRSATGELVARTYGIGQVYGDHRQLLADADVDAVVAILPFALNGQVVEDCLRAGKHVLTEKPQVCTSGRGGELAALAAERGLIYYVGYMKRSDPGVLWARQRIAQWQADGTFGPLLSVRLWCAHGQWTWFSSPALDAGDTSAAYPYQTESQTPWMSAATWQSHVSWTNYYSHQTNLARFLVGLDYQLDTVRRRRVEQVESFFVQCAYEPGGAQLYLDFAGERDAHWNEGFEVKFAGAQLVGHIPAPLARRQITRIECRQLPAQGEPQVSSPLLECIDGFASQARHFVAAIRGQEEALSPASEALKEIEFSESLMRRLQDQDQEQEQEQE